MIEGTLSPSSNRGRYEVRGAADTSVDLTGGQECEILLGEQWIAGVVEHAGGLYVDEDLPHLPHKGYFFVASSDGRPCGLCIGMYVRIS